MIHHLNLIYYIPITSLVVYNLQIYLRYKYKCIFSKFSIYLEVNILKLYILTIDTSIRTFSESVFLKKCIIIFAIAYKLKSIVIS